MQQIAPEVERLALNVSVGQHKMQCPFCQNERSKNRKDRPFSMMKDLAGIKYKMPSLWSRGWLGIR